MKSLILLLSTLLLATAPATARATDTFITVASTTSTRDSGLLAYLLPLFEAKTGIEVRVVAVGTGRALKLGEHGDADVVLVHARAAEDRFMAAGYGLLRRDVMYNDFVIVGPKADPAGIHGVKRATHAFRQLATRKATFLSRGDDSGTHKAERRIWKAAGIDPTPASGTWYRETGNGMGATLNTAAELDAYTLVDRGTWLSFRNRRDLVIEVEGDPPLHNPYGIMIVNPKLHPSVKVDASRKFVDWITSAEGRKAINAFHVDGQQLFHATGSQP